VVRVRLDRKATSISLLVVIGVRADGQKVLLAVKTMGGESTEAWRAVIDDLIKRGLRRPEFLIVDGAAGRVRTRPQIRSSGMKITGFWLGGRNTVSMPAESYQFGFAASKQALSCPQLRLRSPTGIYCPGR